jgi:hypothetical protein
MKLMLWLLSLLSASALAMAVEPEIEVSKQQFKGDAEIGAPSSVEHSFHLKSEGCEITLRLNIISDQRMGYSPLMEYCDSITIESETVLLEKLFEKVFDSGVLGNRKSITIERMSTISFGCRLSRYASTSDDWKALVRKYGNKPIEYHESPPSPLNADLEKFIRKSGLLIELEHILGKHGFYLKRVSVGEFGAVTMQQLSFPQIKKCIADKSGVRIIPEVAEMYLTFEAGARE